MRAQRAYESMEGEDSEDYSEEPPTKSNKKCKVILCCTGCCCCLLILVAAAYGAWNAFLASLQPPAANLCSVDASTAYNDALSLLAEKYAFTEWKGIDWQAVKKVGLAEAQSGNIQLAIQKLVGAVADGHVYIDTAPGACNNGRRLIGTALAEKKKAIGGGYGITISPLDDGTVIVTYVAPGSLAAEKGVVAGQVVTKLNGVPIVQAVTALGEAGWMWSEMNPATADHRLQEQYRTVVRAPIDTVSTWTLAALNIFTPAGDLQLTARDDDYATWKVTKYSMPNDLDVNKSIQVRTLTSGYGYIGLGHFEFDEDYKQVFANAVNTLNNTPGIIIDIRGNVGGSDEQAADFNGLFLPEGSSEVYYEQIAMPVLGEFRTIQEFKSVPTPPFYTKPVVVLVNRGCISTCEGVAKGFFALPTSEVVGFEGTSGSFGMAGASVLFNGDFTLQFPFGRSLDANGNIQVDSNAQLEGGILPTVRFSRTADNAKAFIQYKLGKGATDVELAQAEAELAKMISG
mmetsp:Transcript_103322/g.182098  ORF Transcript_103322/g.182098 Transcript_103322/m.182098 type:complete len:514 (-) Transcript_103322:53-1594(-)